MDNLPSATERPLGKQDGIKTNPGGNIPPEHAIGREQLCQSCWDALENQSIRLENERRLGKTTVIRKLVATTPPNTRAIFMEVGGYTSVIAFIEALMREVDRGIPEKGGQFITNMRVFLNSFKGVKAGLNHPVVGGFSLEIPQGSQSDWHTILDRCFQELSQVTDDRIIFFWDEVPWMIQKIIRYEGEKTGVELLDTLRAIRQTHNNIRMVFTGSIGFHHILSTLERQKNTSEPVNDMARIEVAPLTREFSMLLAHRLLIGENLRTTDVSGTTEALYRLTGGIPYYIQKIIRDLIQDGEATPELVEQKVYRMLSDPNDPWDMKHFSSRLETYYGDLADAARGLLDLLAESETSVTFDSLRTNLQLPVDQHILRNLVRDLERDHYLGREEGFKEGADRYQFKYPLLRRWWRLERGLAA